MDAYQKVHIRALNDGTLSEAGLRTQGNRELRRVRVFGTVVGKYKNEDGSYAALTLDDGSDTIRLKAFREDVPKVEPYDVGQMVDVFGRVREYEEERYLMTDIIRRIDDPNFQLMRNTELVAAAKASGVRMESPGSVMGELAAEEAADEAAPEAVTEEAIEERIDEKPAEPVQVLAATISSVLGKIVELDEGNGVDFPTLMKAAGLDKAGLEAALFNLLNKGDVYEPKSGRFKRLA